MVECGKTLLYAMFWACGCLRLPAGGGGVWQNPAICDVLGLRMLKMMPLQCFFKQGLQNTKVCLFCIHVAFWLLETMNTWEKKRRNARAENAVWRSPLLTGPGIAPASKFCLVGELFGAPALQKTPVEKVPGSILAPARPSSTDCFILMMIRMIKDDDFFLMMIMIKEEDDKRWG